MKRFILLGTLVATLGTPPALGQDIPTKVYLNGVPTPVMFSDGDSFRILAGPHAQTRTRLAGFNTLESHGPVHRWGGWDARELYALAKLATRNAQQGVWRCTTDFEKDGYGRLLYDCPDLALDQVRRGLAHALTIDEKPSDPGLIAAQKQAIAERRGFWAHGVPGYILTSLHGTSEGGGDDEGRHYNRLVSTRDGHSNSMLHTEDYDICQWVCTTEHPVEPEAIAAGVKALRADPTLDLGGLDAARLEQIVDDYARVGWFAGFEEDDPMKAKLEAKLAELASAGRLGRSTEVEGSCVLYIPFEVRYGNDRPGCLR